MPQNCQNVSVQEVISFLETIDATGKRDGHPRNPYLPSIIGSWEEAKLCDLTEDEFLRLIVPDEPHILLRDKDLSTVEGDDSNFVVDQYAERLERNETLPPLVVRYKVEGNIPEASFYIEDGAHKALGYKKYFQTHGYIPVKSYIGNIRGNSIT